uniref:RxLR effector protein n=1 Tax=Biomphalaria glabrata TaxID=6526 RepID=A0A2C9KP75_BIOGL
MFFKVGYLLLVGVYCVSGQAVSAETDNASVETNSAPDDEGGNSKVNDFKESLNNLQNKILLNKAAKLKTAAKLANAVPPVAGALGRDVQKAENVFNTNEKRLWFVRKDAENQENPLNTNEKRLWFVRKSNLEEPLNSNEKRL